MSKKHRGRFKGDPVTYQLPNPAGGVRLETFVPWTLVKRGIKKQVITPLDAPQEFLTEATREREVREAAQDTALMRSLGLAHVPEDRHRQGMVAAFARTIWAQPDEASAHAQLGRIAEHLSTSFPKAAETLLTRQGVLGCFSQDLGRPASARAARPSSAR